MSQTGKVKRALETAATLKVTSSPSSVVQTWTAICNDPESTPSLVSIATLRRRELEAAIVRNDSEARALAIQALAALAETTT